MSETTIRYGGWSRDRQGWLLGLTGGAWIAIVLAGAPVLTAMGAHRWLAVLALLPTWALVVVLVAVPIRGRPALRWFADVVLHLTGGVMGWSSWTSRAVTGDVPDLSEVQLPGVMAGLRMIEAPSYGPQLERPVLIQDRAAQTWAAVARIVHPGIGLAEPAARAQMAAGLADLLEGAATTELISLLTIQVRTIPDDGAERVAWQRRNVQPHAPEVALLVSRQLQAAMLTAGVRHESFVTVVVPENRLARQAKDAGGGVDGRARVLHTVMSEIEGRLGGALGCTSVAWLTSPELAAVIRTGFAPGDRAGLTEAALLSVSTPGIASALPMAAAGPTRAPAPPRRHYTHDAWSSVTCTVLLPERGAVMGALAPVFVPTTPGERRCVTVFYQPLGNRKADRLVGNEAISAGLGADLRHRMGFQTRASHRRDEARVAGQDARLADGRALVRVAVAAAVTVPSAWPVADFGQHLEASIRGAGFHPLRLDLAQDSGFAAACVPVGIGLPRRRGLL